MLVYHSNAPEGRRRLYPSLTMLHSHINTVKRGDSHKGALHTGALLRVTGSQTKPAV